MSPGLFYMIETLQAFSLVKNTQMLVIPSNYQYYNKSYGILNF